MKIAVIGAGNVGTALGEGWREHGHDVAYGIRGDGKAPAGARAAAPRAAVDGSEVVVLATPWTAVATLAQELGDFGGRVLVDATNPIGPGFQLAVGRTTSGAEELQRVAKGARVVKAFNSVGFEILRSPGFPGGAATMLVAGDDPEATAAVASLAGDLGFDGIALKGLAHARAIEPIAMLWISLSRLPEWGRRFALGLRRRKGPAAAAVRRTKRPLAITIYGAGHIGGNLARAWLRAGHEVRLAVRDNDSQAVRALIDAGAKAVDLQNSAGSSDVVVLAVPAAAAGDVLGQAGDLKGKVVIDCTNAIGKGFVLEAGLTTSAAEQLQARVPGALVVKAFNQQGAETLEDPLFDGVPTISFVAGDDAGARARASSLAEDLGMLPLDAGPLTMARYLEPLTLAWIAASASVGSRQIGLVLLKR